MKWSFYFPGIDFGYLRGKVHVAQLNFLLANLQTETS